MSSTASPISSMSVSRLLPLSPQSSSYSIVNFPLRFPPHKFKLFLSCTCTSSDSSPIENGRNGEFEELREGVMEILGEPRVSEDCVQIIDEKGRVFSGSSPIDGGSNGELEMEQRELREGVMEILAETGVSEVDYVEIAENSPKYTKMLRDGVRDLDELSLWDSWMGEKAEKEKGESGMAMARVPMSLKEKVKHIAREKGDNGKIPYLESVGLSLSSSTHLGRLLSSETLPSLIHKVKFVKEIFFSGSDDELLAGKLARRMMLHLSIRDVDEDVQQTLSFFEKIEARRGGLDMLGSADVSFRNLIESFPRLLLLSIESNIKPIVKYLEDIGVPRHGIGNTLLLFPPLLFLDIGSIRAGLQPFKEAGGRVLMKYPWVVSRSIWRNYKDILAFLEAEQVPKISIDRAVQDWPLLLGCSTKKLKPMVEQFTGLGLRTTRLGKVLRISPQLLLFKPEEFQKVVSFLRDLGFDKESLGQILARCPEIFATSTENTLQKKVEFLTNLGILKPQLPRVIKKYPEFFVSDVDRTVMPRLRYLMKVGLSRRDIASMVIRFSPLLGYNIELVLRPKLEFLINTMQKPLKEVVGYPRYFSYSLENKIKPRFFKLRQSGNTECSLQDMLAKNNEAFTADTLESRDLSNM